jgi:GrpB-like predicted nucleotidyltransferase (UPF0157 family)
MGPRRLRLSIMNENPERIVLCDYDSTWPERFIILADRARSALGALVARVEHIGSTAVPGLAAKPIIDLDFVVASVVDIGEAIRLLARIGYVHQGESRNSRQGGIPVASWRAAASPLCYGRGHSRVAPPSSVSRRPPRRCATARSIRCVETEARGETPR